MEKSSGCCCTCIGGFWGGRGAVIERGSNLSVNSVLKEGSGGMVKSATVTKSVMRTELVMVWVASEIVVRELVRE
jgi:hypothetical protein